MRHMPGKINRPAHVSMPAHLLPNMPTDTPDHQKHNDHQRGVLQGGPQGDHDLQTQTDQMPSVPEGGPPGERIRLVGGSTKKSVHRLLAETYGRRQLPRIPKNSRLQVCQMQDRVSETGARLPTLHAGKKKERLYFLSTDGTALQNSTYFDPEMALLSVTLF